MKPGNGLTIERVPESRRKSGILFVFSLIIMFGAAVGFGGKIFEFLKTWRSIPEAKFALIPVAIYFSTAVGFACFFIYGALHGMLTDIEGPKYRMLEEALEQERREAVATRDPDQGDATDGR